jgi:hypothetical protein
MIASQWIVNFIGVRIKERQLLVEWQPLELGNQRLLVARRRRKNKDEKRM